MENNCYFVSSRGLLKSCTFHSKNPISSCNSDKTYLIQMVMSNNMFNGMSIYVCSDLLKFFVNIILPKIKNNFTLVSGDSDLIVPKEILSIHEFNYLLNNTYLSKWFTQNMIVNENYKINKIIQIPIGLDYHTICNDPKNKLKKDDERHLPKDQEQILMDIRNIMKPFYERECKIYVNFSMSNDRFGQRNQSLSQIPSDLLVKHNDFIKRTDNWNNIIKYSFVLSPYGNGMDCHRTWESICLGSIPIVLAPNFKHMFKDLPVLIVNNWSDITEELLNNTIEEYKTKTFNYDKISLSYWENLINKN